MSGIKRAADAAPRFQERLKTQITRSTAVLLTAFLLLFGVLLAIYSEGYTYYAVSYTHLTLPTNSRV